jgi:hypothetical protein
LCVSSNEVVLCSVLHQETQGCIQQVIPLDGAAPLHLHGDALNLIDHLIEALELTPEGLLFLVQSDPNQLLLDDVVVNEVIFTQSLPLREVVAEAAVVLVGARGVLQQVWQEELADLLVLPVQAFQHNKAWQRKEQVDVQGVQLLLEFIVFLGRYFDDVAEMDQELAFQRD